MITLASRNSVAQRTRICPVNSHPTASWPGKDLALSRAGLLPRSVEVEQEPSMVDEIPARAFDTRRRKQRVAAILDNTTILTADEPRGCGFARLLASARRASFANYLWLPARARRRHLVHAAH